MKKSETREARLRRHRRVREKLSGTGDRPRLCIFRSLNHIYAQVIDDVKGQTLATASSLDDEISNDSKGKTKTGRAEMVGELLARRAREKKIIQVAFDRGGFQYHGRVKALAEAARKGGLKF
ncbi:MAG TPA: 50S ribosomal protein L18 [Dehalococcoidales bacterium]|nr:50S ribosomal protein L18 [Dehalococcoidales bacterium]